MPDNIESSTPLRMQDVRCEYVSYQFRAAFEKFELDEFRRSVQADKETQRDRRVCNTKNAETADYHVHFEWRLRTKDDEIRIDVGFVAGANPPAAGEIAPFAEDLMPWLGQFFKFGEAHASIHADFVFGSNARQSWFPLPLKTKIMGLNSEAEIDGISVSLPSEPHGVSRIFLSHIKDSVLLGLNSGRRIKFATFDLSKELQIISTVADKLIEAK